MSHWGYWINEPVYLDTGVFNVEKRKHALTLFCKEGLLPFLKRAGYTLRLHEREVITNLLQMLYALHKGKRIEPVCLDVEYAKEQYDMYCYVLGYEEWEQLWKAWGSFQDFAEGGIGHSLRFTLPEFVWTWLNLETSPTAIQLYKEIEEEEYEDELAKGKDDPYLQDTSKRDYQDRHWH